MLITDGSRGCEERCEESPALADVDYIQVREPSLSTRALADYARGLVRKTGPRVLVNDRSDVAIACGAAGVHLRDLSLSPELVRRVAPAGFVITVACHDAEAVFRAADEGADLAVLAPIFAPLSKPVERPPLGLDELGRIASRATIPVIALGGITAENALLCAAVGAAGVAGITLYRRPR